MPSFSHLKEYWLIKDKVTQEIVSYAAIFCLVTQHYSLWGEALREETMAAYETSQERKFFPNHK